MANLIESELPFEVRPLNNFPLSQEFFFNAPPQTATTGSGGKKVPQKVRIGPPPRENGHKVPQGPTKPQPDKPPPPRRQPPLAV